MPSPLIILMNSFNSAANLLFCITIDVQQEQFQSILPNFLNSHAVLSLLSYRYFIKTGEVTI